MDTLRETRRLIDCINTYSTREATLRLGIDVCRTLVSYRNMGINHLVLTPKDITVSENGDIGLSLVTLPVINDGEFTSPIQLYTAPELLKGVSGEAAVVYSLGTIMYRLMNGGLEPFRKEMDYESAAEAYAMRMSGQRVSAPSNADAALSAIILKACEFDTSRRYSSLSEMMEELIKLQNGSFQKEVQKETKPEPLQKPRLNKNSILYAVICGLVVSLAIVFFFNLHYNDLYVRAERKLRDDKFSEARQMFEDISWYKDSSVLVYKCDYDKAQKLLSNGKTDDAIELYDTLVKVGYEDSFDKKNEALLMKADALKAEGKSDEAMAIIASVAEQDGDKAEQKLKEHRYDNAMEMYRKGDYEEALEIFASLGDTEMESECKYSIAGKLRDSGNYARAMAIFSELDGYGDSGKQFELCLKWLSADNEGIEYDDIVGKYTDEDGHYIEYNLTDGIRKSKYNIPFEKGAYFKLKDGIHYHSDDKKNWKKQWIIEINGNSIDVYCFADKKLYTLAR